MTSVRLSRAFVRDRTTPGSRFRRLATGLTVNGFPGPRAAAKWLPPPQLTYYNSAVGLAWSFPLAKLSLSFTFSARCNNRGVDSQFRKWNRCRTLTCSYMPHSRSSRLLPPWQPDWLVRLQTHTFIRFSLSLTPPPCSPAQVRTGVCHHLLVEHENWSLGGKSH